MEHIVAIIGRPNVGKSTLFNRLVGRQPAIVDDMPGITRDRHYGIVTWCGRSFTIIDTGGYAQKENQPITRKVHDQIAVAISEACIVLFVLDCKEALMSEDLALADLLRKNNKKVIVVANKADNAKVAINAHNFHSLGLGPVYPIAATHGTGTGELMDAVINYLPDEATTFVDDTLPKIALIGRANVGKSTFINALLGKERSIVDEQPHTTRSPVHTHYRLYQKEFILIDTAGIARKKQVQPNSIPFYALIRSIKAIEEADVCLLLIDAEEGFTTQDRNILNLTQRKKKAVVLLVNKWDLVAKDHATFTHYKKTLQAALDYLRYLPILFTSGRYKKHIHQAIEAALKVYKNKYNKVPTPQLNRIVQEAVLQHPPPMLKGKRIKINYATQLTGRHPIFAMFCNLPQYIPMNYKRYLENKIRQATHFEGVPITLIFKRK